MKNGLNVTESFQQSNVEQTQERKINTQWAFPKRGEKSDSIHTFNSFKLLHKGGTNGGG